MPPIKAKSKKHKVIILTIFTLIVLVIAGIVVALRVKQDTPIGSTQTVKESYLACGCGGCGGGEPEVVYYSISKGQESGYRQAIADDKTAAASKSCANMGCSICKDLRLID